MMHSIFSHRQEGASRKHHLMPIAYGHSFTPAGHFFAALPLLFLFLFLPACGGTSGGGGGPQPPGVPGVIGLTVIPDSESLQVSWTNPNIDSITGFDITWQRTHDADGDAVTEAASFNKKNTQTEAGVNASYRIRDVLDNHVYTISVTVLTVNGSSAARSLPDRVPGPNMDNDQLADHLDNCPTLANSDQANEDNDSLGDVCEDADDDKIFDGIDNCPADFNPQQENVNNDGEGDACETDAAQRPATGGVMDPIVIPGEESLSLAWTNPAGFITAFNIGWVNADDPGDTGMDSIDTFSEQTNTNSETSSSFAISPLTNNTNYNITITLMADADNSYSTEVLEATTGVNGDGDTILAADDNCPTIANSDQSNQDTDSAGDACDVDDDNDGLIEIRTAAELDNIRHNLAGTGYTQDDGEETNSAGCPVDSCHGYELTANISLAGMHWIPVGGDANDERFTADFDGNGNVISNVTITSAGGVLGSRTYIGFFARMNGATIKNLGMMIERLVVEGDAVFVGGLSGHMENTEVMNSYVIFSDVLSIKNAASGPLVGGLSGTMNGNLTVERVYTVLPNNLSITKAPGLIPFVLQIGGIFGGISLVAVPMPYPISINNSYVIYRDAPMFSTTGTLRAFLYGFGVPLERLENSYVFFEGDLSITQPKITSNLNILPPSARSSYFNARTDTGNSNYRTLPQLRCPTGPDATCDGADGSLEGTNTTYADWDASIWDFGDENTLPTLRGIPPCPAGYPYDECRFGRSPE